MNQKIDFYSDTFLANFNLNPFFPAALTEHKK